MKIAIAARFLRSWWYELGPAEEAEAAAWAAERSRRVDSLGLHHSTDWCLDRHGISAVADLAMKDEQTVADLKGIGKKGLQSIKDGLATRGLRLGMTQEEVDAVPEKEGCTVHRSSTSIGNGHAKS